MAAQTGMMPEVQATAAPSGPAPGRRRLSRRTAPYLMILPQMVLVGAFAMYPLLENLILSFQSWSPEQSRWVGTDNYERIIHDDVFWQALRNTFVYTVGSVLFSVLVGFIAALCVNQRVRGRLVFRTLFLLPYLFSWVIVGIIWQWLYSPEYGLLNYLLAFFGIGEYEWLRDPSFAMPGLIIATVWYSAGFYMVIFLGGLQTIPAELHEAARIDGASSIRRLLHITIPLLRPIALLVTVMATITSMRAFDLIYVMTGGGPGQATNVIVLYIYQQAFQAFQLGYGAALSIVLLVIVIVLAVLQLKVFRPNE